MKTPDETRERSASLYRWLTDHFGGAAMFLPEKVITHFEVDIPDLIAAYEAATAAQPELHDKVSDLWTWHSAGYLRYDDGAPLSREQLDAEYGPTHEVVN